MVTDFVAWLGLDKTDINPNDVLSAGIEEINVASAGVLTKVEGSPVEFSPIFETSSDAAVVGSDKVGFGADPLALLRNYVSGGHKLVLAARLSGEAKSAFPDGAPKPAPADDKKPPTRMRKRLTTRKKPASPTPPSPAPDKAAKADHVTSGKINVIVVADTDLLADQFWVNRRELAGQDVIMPTAHNAAFVVGALENLSGSNALIGLRGRGVKDRPFTLVEDLRRSAEQKFRAKEEALEEKLKSAQSELQKIQTSSARQRRPFGEGAGGSRKIPGRDAEHAARAERRQARLASEHRRSRRMVEVRQHRLRSAHARRGRLRSFMAAHASAPSEAEKRSLRRKSDEASTLRGSAGRGGAFTRRRRHGLCFDAALDGRRQRQFRRDAAGAADLR